jgi:hypothetical protein
MFKKPVYFVAFLTKTLTVATVRLVFLFVGAAYLGFLNIR